jgi:thioredoxin 1
MMPSAKNLAIVVLVVVGVGTVAWLKTGRQSPAVPADPQQAASPQASQRRLPRLVELGAGKCEACKKMAPIIEALRREYAGRVEVESIDVIAEEDRARPFEWRLIPLQVFLDADGKELWRHEGFLAKEEIVGRLRVLKMVAGPEERPRDTTSTPVAKTVQASGNSSHQRQVADTKASREGLVRLVDLGADRCIPCKMMAPILEEVKTEYAGRAVVEFIDVWKDRDAGRKYGVQAIPTQIFYDCQGKEVWRHEGFLPKELIIAKFHELGVK